MSNDSTVDRLKEFEGMKLKEVKRLANPNIPDTANTCNVISNLALIFESEDGTYPSMNFLGEVQVLTIKAKDVDQDMWGV